MSTCTGHLRRRVGTDWVRGQACAAAARVPAGQRMRRKRRLRRWRDDAPTAGWARSRIHGRGPSAARSGPAVDFEHDPTVIEDLAFCEVYSTVQAAMCTQGYCDGSGIAVVEADDDC